MKTLALSFLAVLTLSLVSWTQPAPTETSPAAPTGRVYGPADATRRVEAYSTYADRIMFRGNELARVTIEGDGDCDLDLYIYNDEGMLVAKDDDYTDYCVASWTPNYTKSYRIIVRNRSGVYANYRLMSN